MTYEPNGEAKFQQQPDTPAPDEQYHTETSDGSLELTVEADGSISEINGEPVEDAAEDDSAEDVAPAEDAAPVAPPPGGSIGSDGKVYYGVGK